MINKYLVSNENYKVIVGKGGSSQYHENGYDSMIVDGNDEPLIIDDIKLIGFGGGRGYSYTTDSSILAKDGGSGGGGSGKSIQGNTYWDLDSKTYIAGGHDGGNHNGDGPTRYYNYYYDMYNGYNVYFSPFNGAAGGGAGEKGGSKPQYLGNKRYYSDSDIYDWGGDGILNDITGTPVYYAGGGNYGLINTDNYLLNDFYRSKGGGGLVHNFNNQDKINAQARHVPNLINYFDGIPHSGSGGGSCTLGYQSTTAGNGGSGIVIIKKSDVKNLKLHSGLKYYDLIKDYYKDENQEILNYESSTGIINTDKPIVFKNTGENQTNFDFKLENDGLYDILIVGGGGAGGIGNNYKDNIGSQNGGGGGGGGVVYMVNKYLISTENYKVIVGKGGSGELMENGYDSMILDDNNEPLIIDDIKLIGFGGGHGYSRGILASDGGSGGGATGKSIQGNTYWDGEKYIAGGHDGGRNSYGYHDWVNGKGGGGGGASQKGATNPAVSYIHSLMYDCGGDGILNTITGIPTYYAGGGNYPLMANYGILTDDRHRSKGGGGLAFTWKTSNKTVYDYIYELKGIEHTGSGGGGIYKYTNSIGSDGGSGIVILRKSENYKKIKMYLPIHKYFITESYINYDNSIIYETDKEIHNGTLNYLIQNNFGIDKKSEIISKSSYIKLEYYIFEKSEYPLNVLLNVENNNTCITFKYDISRSVNNVTKYIIKSNVLFNGNLVIGNVRYNNIKFGKLLLLSINNNNNNNNIIGLYNDDYISGDGDITIEYNENIKTSDLYLPRFIMKYKLKSILNSIAIGVDRLALPKYNYKNAIDNMLSQNLVYFIKFYCVFEIVTKVIS